MVKWTLILHFYQPPTQSLAVTEAVLRQCYLPLADLLLAHPEAKLTLNISGSLLENIKQIPDNAFIEKVKILLGRRQIELTNSAVYHPLLPLITLDEIEKDLILNREVIRNTFQTEPTETIYPPEMAVNEEVVKLLQGLGMAKNLIIDESSLNYDFELGKLPLRQIIHHDGLTLLVNSRSVSETLRSYPKLLTGEKFKTFLESFNQAKAIISVSDAEVFGHHYSERITLLSEMFSDPEVQFMTVSETLLENGAAEAAKEDVKASTWQSTREDLKNNNPYPLWLSPDNKLQQMYNELAVKAYGLLESAPDSQAKGSAERHYHRGISSCHYFWLSNRPWWHPDLVETGAKELIRCIRSLDVGMGAKSEAEKFYHEFLMAMWQYHWSGEVEKKFKEYDENRKKFLESLPIK